VENLLSNASKYTDRHGTITLGLRQDAHAVRIEVQDTGVGIEPAQLPGLFELLAQADAQSDGPGRGATFTVELPRPGAGGPGRASPPHGAP
jgi:signal transduction histidine kinase